ncbi:MAG: cob(I)yrinic acid a,c-diamide adenosyltransferase [Candidatus Uhrbacteria bacterium]
MENTNGFGLIQIYTGDGKGKTTAALGQVVRAVGANKRVAVLFFDKGGERYCERIVLDRLGVDWWAFGRDRRITSDKFDFTITDQDRVQAARGLDKLSQLFESKKYDLIVLDELNTTTNLGMIKVDEVLSILNVRPDTIELILTGRNAPQELLDRADLVSEVQNKKHYFDQGIQARQGLDF